MDKKTERAELALPIGFTSDGDIVTLADVAAGRREPMPPSSLDAKAKRTLAAQRIEANPQFSVHGITTGNVSKQRALAEIEANSQLGNLLVDVEMRTVDRLLRRFARAKEHAHAVRGD